MTARPPAPRPAAAPAGAACSPRRLQPLWPAALAARAQVRCRTVTRDTKAVDAVHTMGNPSPVTFVPVVESDGVLVGLLTLNGVVAAGL